MKQELHNENFWFVDGYDFSGSEFDPQSISRTADHTRGPYLRVFNTFDNARQTFVALKRRREVYEFYQEAPVEDFSDEAIKHLKLQIPNYDDICNII